MVYSTLQVREIFHLCFLQEFLRKFNPQFIILKGGVNLRFFFKSRRYSEDMDLDVKTASIASIQKNVLKTLRAIIIPMRVYGITSIIPPTMKNAKQTETTQRFKIHLRTQNGLDLFTKIEFSRRKKQLEFGKPELSRIDDHFLREYRLAPIVVPHYNAISAFEQKIQALAGRSITEARDVYDLYHLLSFIPKDYHPRTHSALLKEASRRAQEISFKHYRESVVTYLTTEDQNLFGMKETWEDIQKKVLEAIHYE